MTHYLDFFPNAHFNKNLQNWLIRHCLFYVSRIARLETAHHLSSPGEPTMPSDLPLIHGIFSYSVLFRISVLFKSIWHETFQKSDSIFRPKLGYSCSQLVMKALSTSYLRCTKDKPIPSWKLSHPLHTSEKQSSAGTERLLPTLSSQLGTNWYKHNQKILSLHLAVRAKREHSSPRHSDCSICSLW